MHKLLKHHTVEELNTAARKAKKGRVATRILMIRDIASGMSRGNVCAQYGASTATVSLCVRRYNAGGLSGLEDKPRTGARCKLHTEQQAAFRERVLKQPDIEKDGLVRWRLCDVQKVLAEEFKALYRSEQGVSRLMKSLGIVRLTTRPSHPKKNAQEAEDFKKNSPVF
jgi:transposase